jgi:rhodanese-related sulfurtransferase/rubrerythrin
MGNDVRGMKQNEFLRFTATHSSEEFTLLDVRQPGEYEEAHLPGAMLIPLPELWDKLDSLDRSKTVIVYCRTGGRSMAAASMLYGQGHTQVTNLVGGITSYKGGIARGPIRQGFALISAAAPVADVLWSAYVMESNLNLFYKRLAEEVTIKSCAGDSGKLVSLFQKLAAFEFGHIRLLEHVARREIPGFHGWKEHPKHLEDVLEGGWNVQELLSDNPWILESEQDALETAMSLEAQALDLYFRYSQRALGAAVSKIYLDLAREEQRHMVSLAEWVDRMGPDREKN